MGHDPIVPLLKDIRPLEARALDEQGERDILVAWAIGMALPTQDDIVLVRHGLYVGHLQRGCTDPSLVPLAVGHQLRGAVAFAQCRPLGEDLTELHTLGIRGLFVDMPVHTIEEVLNFCERHDIALYARPRQERRPQPTMLGAFSFFLRSV